MSRTSVLITVLIVVAIAVAAVYGIYRRDIAGAYQALQTYQTVRVATSHGAVEAVDVGQGTVVLSIHGTGGGYDQGLALAAPMRAAGYRVIAPSRFGYLGTQVPERADAVAQADAYAELLDALGVERVVVMGASAGAITALHFAARYPERTIALLAMVPAYYPEKAAPPPWSPLMARAMNAGLRSDFLFWAGLRVFPTAASAALLATDRALIEAADAPERARLGALMAMIQPVSARADGLMLDMQHTATPVRVDLGAITAPSFVASAEDDRYLTADSARMLADGIAGAELLITPDGGHVWVGRNDEVSTAALDFIARAVAR